MLEVNYISIKLEKIMMEIVAKKECNYWHQNKHTDKWKISERTQKPSYMQEIDFQ